VVSYIKIVLENDQQLIDIRYNINHSQKLANSITIKESLIESLCSKYLEW